MEPVVRNDVLVFTIVESRSHAWCFAYLTCVDVKTEESLTESTYPHAVPAVLMDGKDTARLYARNESDLTRHSCIPVHHP